MHPRGRRPSSTSRAEPGPAAPPTATPASTPAAGRLFLLPSPSFPTPCLVLPFRLLAGPPPVGWSRRAGLVGRGPGDAGRGKQRRGGGDVEACCHHRPRSGGRGGPLWGPRPRVDPDCFPGPVQRGRVRVPHAPGEVPATCLAMCVSLAFRLHQLHLQPLSKEKGGGEPRPWGAGSLPRAGGVSACSVRPRGEEAGKGFRGSLGGRSLEGRREDGRCGRRGVNGQLPRLQCPPMRNGADDVPPASRQPWDRA